MRSVATFIVLAAMTAGAEASSIVTLQLATASPSIVVLGSPARSSMIVIADSASPQRSSIVAFGAPAPSVDAEQVAAIPAAPKTAPRGPAQLPMVMRGGIAGDAFATAETAPQATEEPAVADPETAAAPDGGLAPPGESSSEPPVVVEEVPDGPVLR